MFSTATKLSRANTMFSALAKPFVPGQLWMKPRRLKWHTKGITRALHFDVKDGALARKAGSASRLIGRPASPIAIKDRKAAQPFTIPKPEPTLEEQLDNLYDMYPLLTPHESNRIQDIRNEYGLGTPRLYRTQPCRFNYCDN
jgi:hypothetical protein